MLKTEKIHKTRTKKPKKIQKPKKPTTWYLGFDGSFVLSSKPLHVERDSDGAPFLSTSFTSSIIDIFDHLVPRELFPDLQMFQVVKITVRTAKPYPARIARKRKP